MVDVASATERFLGLLNDDVLFVDELRPLRERVGLVVRSLAVNGPRVDVVAGDAEDEWRVVFAVASDRQVDWLHVYRRPERFDGVAGGRLVVVNGPSSVGKSTLLAALQLRSRLPWVVFDEPHLGAVRAEHLIWREGRDVLHRGFLAGIAALAREGNLVAVAAGGHAQSSFDQALSGVRTVRVGLDCSVDELERRERERNDVYGGLALSSLGVHEGWSYDLRFDTSVTPMAAIADAVQAAVDRC